MLIFLFGFTLVSTAVAVGYPLAFRWAIDRAAELLAGETEVATVGRIMLILALIGVGRFIAGFYPATRALMNLLLERDIREDVFGEITHKDHRFAVRFRTGDVVTRLTDDIADWPKIAWFGCSGIFRALESASKLIFCIVAMLLLDWRLTLLSLTPLPVMMWIFYRLRTKLKSYVEEARMYVSRTSSLLEAAFSSIRIIKALTAEEGQEENLARLLRKRVHAFMRLVKVEGFLENADVFATRLGQMIVLGFGGILAIRGEISIGTLFAFVVYLDMLSMPMIDIPNLFSTGQQAFVSIDRVEEIRSFPAVQRPSGSRRLERIDSIGASDLGFAYEGGRPVLDGVEFEVPAGSFVAVVGGVGSGKSTLIKLLAGVLTPVRGDVMVNGRPLSEIDLGSFRQMIGYVPQEALLFSEPVRENVLLGRRVPEGAKTRVKDEETWIRQCLSLAQMDADLERMPKGIDTVLGQKGTLVSGGQRQRIAIARALAGNPQLLLLDDCTAALDASNEAAFWSSLRRQHREMTCFVVTHRLNTIASADVILVLDRGRLVDVGTHEELLGRCQPYRAFVETEQKKMHLGLSA